MGFTDNPLGQETNWSLDALSQRPSRICVAVSSQCYQCPAAFYSLPPSALCFGFTWRWRLALSLENILIAWKAEKQNCQNLGYNYSLIETSLYISKNCSHLAMFSFKEMETEKKRNQESVPSVTIRKSLVTFGTTVSVEWQGWKANLRQRRR